MWKQALLEMARECLRPGLAYETNRGSSSVNLRDEGFQMEVRCIAIYYKNYGHRLDQDFPNISPLEVIHSTFGFIHTPGTRQAVKRGILFQPLSEETILELALLNLETC